jgi:hypothetical protein
MPASQDISTRANDVNQTDLLSTVKSSPQGPAEAISASRVWKPPLDNGLMQL